ncbi:hypothetical protein HK104_000256 [Borealophlyctis nickersoniae]|nr:hypothetical protein HK104_000256 [Borealophlyctis nickersoniae]
MRSQYDGDTGAGPLPPAPGSQSVNSGAADGTQNRRFWMELNEASPPPSTGMYDPAYDSQYPTSTTPTPLRSDTKGSSVAGYATYATSEYEYVAPPPPPAPYYSAQDPAAYGADPGYAHAPSPVPPGAEYVNHGHVVAAPYTAQEGYAGGAPQHAYPPQSRY